MFNFLILCFYLCFWLGLSQPQAEASPLMASVEVCPGPHDSFAETRAAALNEARREILLQGGEVWISAQTAVAAGVVQDDWLQLFSSGVVSQEKVLAERWLPAKEQMPPCYALTLQATVSVLQKAGESELDLRLWLPESQLTEGQAVELNLLSASGGYLTLVNVSADGSVTLLLPNARMPMPYYLEPGQLSHFPALLNQADLKLVARVLPGQASSREVLKGILTRTPLQLGPPGPFNQGPFKQGLFQVYDRFGTGLYGDFMRLLLALPAQSWNESSFVYQISRDTVSN